MKSSMDLIPGLPNDVALECLIRIPFASLPPSRHVSIGWKAKIELPEFHLRRKSTGLTQPVIVIAQAWTDPTRKHTASPFYRLVLYDPGTGEWSDLPPVPDFPEGLPFLCHVVGVRSELVLLGGCDLENWRVLASVLIYNFVSGTWRSGAEMPGGQRLFFACASDSDRMVYIAGGHDQEKNAVGSALAYDVAEDKWTPMPDMAIARDECMGIFHDGKFHVIGGYTTEAQGQFRREAEAFDVATWRWGQVDVDYLKDAACTINCACVSCHDGKMYMCQNGSVTEREGATWRILTGLPVGLCHVEYVTAWQGKLFVIGCSKFEEDHRAYVMDLKSYVWTRIEASGDYMGHVQSGCYLEI